MMVAERILEAAFSGIWEMSMTAGYCIAAVLLLRLVLHRVPRKYLYALWLVVAFRLVCPVSVNTEFSLFNLRLFAGETPVSADDYAGDGGIQDRDYEADMPAQDAGEAHFQETARFVPGEAAGAASRLRRDAGEGRLAEAGFREAGKYIWAAGVLAFALYFAVSMAKMRRRVRSAVRIGQDGRVAGEAGSREGARVRICECGGLSSPFVMGIFRPCIYLPSGLTAEQREMVLLHEQCHIRRKDHLVKYLSFGLLALYWFHPLVWAAWFGMCRDMEMSCDEKVLELLGGKRRKAYTRTLLELASERGEPCGVPLAFGELDVKKRIRHALSFRKPAVWVAVMAVSAVVLALVLLGTDGAEDGGGAAGDSLREEDEGQSLAGKLYEARNPYVGDAPANGRLIGAIGEVFPDSVVANTAFKTELQTSEEPYEFCFRLIKEPPESGLMKEMEDLDMTDAAVLMLALTDNLGVVRWSYETEEGEVLPGGGSLDAAGAARWCGSEDVREFAVSAEGVQCLLDRIESLDVRPWDSSYAFMSWYAALPEELYEQAVPIDEETDEAREGAEPRMYLLARTEDGTVSVYGCRCYRYGDRGITVVYRGTDGENHYSYMDEHYWGGKLSDSGTEVCAADYDQDGRREIALRRVTAAGRGGRTERLSLYEIGSDETLTCAGVCTEENYREEIDRCVTAVVDNGNLQVQVVRRAQEDAGEEPSLEPILTIPYEEGQQILGVHFDGDVRFLLGDEIWLETTVGLSLKDFPGIWYGHEEEERERKLRFRVIYEASADAAEGRLVLAGPQTP